MNNELTLSEGLKAYLIGLGRSNPDALAFIAEYGHWPDLAVREIERRAAAVLAGLSDIELVAIAWEVDLREIAQQVQAELGKEQ